MQLKRTLTLPLVTFYGLGSIIGAGIYALIGAVAQEAKIFTPCSFIIAALIAFFTATTYAELSSRFPQSAGTSMYVKKAFGQTWLSGLVGWLVVITGIVSSGALLHGLINYLNMYITISSYLLIPLIITILGSIVIWGITESALTIFMMTLLEIAGLLIIIWYGRNNFGNAILEFNQFIPPLQSNTLMTVFSGAFIAFYAFIGFEDMVNVAEETKNPEKNMPFAIMLAASVAILLYIIISIITVTSLHYNDLVNSKTPLALIIKQQGHSPLLFAIIAMVSITNGILVNIIMASRLIYGMAKLNTAPQLFAKIYQKTQVPLYAIILVILFIIIMTYWLPIQILAKTTSSIILFIFILMHIALITVKITHTKISTYFNLPIIFPIIGLILSLLFLPVAII